MDNGEFHLQPISSEELKKIITGLDCNKSNLNGSIPKMYGKTHAILIFLTLPK